MKNNWISLVGCLALAAGQTGLYAQDDETPPATVAEPTPATQAPLGLDSNLDPVADTLDSSALGFRRVTQSGGFADAERTTVRVVQAGRIVQTRRVGEGGVAQISDVAAGAYSVFANGNEGFAAYGIYLGDNAHISGSRVGLVPQRDSQTVRRFIQNHLQTPAAGGPSAADRNEATITDASAENTDFELQADGSVSAQIVRAAPGRQRVQPIANLHVAFVRDGQIVAEAVTDTNGEFTASGMNPGIYSLAVAGTQGFAAYSAAIVQPEGRAQARVRQFHFVALLAKTVTIIVPVPPGDFPQFTQPVGPSDSAPPAGAMGTGGFGGGGAGAGGGAGGGFGGGGLLGALAGVGAGIGAAAAFNDDGNGPVSPPAP